MTLLPPTHIRYTRDRCIIDVGVVLTREDNAHPQCIKMAKWYYLHESNYNFMRMRKDYFGIALEYTYIYVQHPPGVEHTYRSFYWFDFQNYYQNGIKQNHPGISHCILYWHGIILYTSYRYFRKTVECRDYGNLLNSFNFVCYFVRLLLWNLIQKLTFMRVVMNNRFKRNQKHMKEYKWYGCPLVECMI